MAAYDKIIQTIEKNKEKAYLIHYSCQSLSDDNEGYSPRITSIAVLHMISSQMHSFSVHLVAEEMDIPREQIFEKYDEIEKRMLEQYFDFISHRIDNSIWMHWNMSNINYGFEVLEHRYRILTKNVAIHIDETSKYNLSHVVKKKYGSNYAKDPKMLNLMLLNGGVDRNFLNGEEEVRAFKAKEFVKLHNSTMCKVYFFKMVYTALTKNKLQTDTNQFKYKVAKLYENPIVQIISIIGIIISIISLFIGFFH